MHCKLTILATSLLVANVTLAATPINLTHQSGNYLQKFSLLQGQTGDRPTLKSVESTTDFNQITHTRIQQMVAGVPVWDATAVIHTPKATPQRGNNFLTTNNNTTMNGVIYEGLNRDLANTPSYALSDAQKTKAMETAKLAYAKKSGIKLVNSTQETTKVIVFVDKKNIAHYAFLTSFFVDDKQTGAHRPTFIIDATSLEIYRTWDQVMTLETTEQLITAGGIGGNEKTGPLIYDGATGHLDGLKVQTSYFFIPGQAVQIPLCVLSNPDAEVRDVSYDNAVTEAVCLSEKGKHNDISWISRDKNETRWEEDEMNGGYSPSLDVFYAATAVKKFYQDWYGVPVLVNENGSPMRLILRTHYGRRFENAYWDGTEMTFGDGDKLFYPLTSPDIVAHEMSHGFTEQHSHLNEFHPQMRALHESFSDMASVAFQYYLTHQNRWEIGSTIMKGPGALRYLDDPKKDGYSIDTMRNVTIDENTDPHLLAGVFNKAFYVLATTPNWDIQKAFNVMVKANMNYWTSSMTTFNEAACGVVSATRDYHYDIRDVNAAFAQVGIETNQC